MRKNKYNARRVLLDGYKFDSQREAKRYAELRLLKAAGKIDCLEVHPRYTLRAAVGSSQSAHIGTYIADFRYQDLEKNTEVVEDVKGAVTAVYRLKKKIVEANYGISITEIR